MIRPDIDRFEANGTTLEAHRFAPPGEPTAVVAFFHPGGFTMGDPTWGYRFAEAHLDRNHAFVSLSYRHLAAGLTFDDLLDDAAAGLQRVAEDHGDLPVFSSGHSAGGFLALVPVLRSLDFVVAGSAVLSTVPRVGTSMAQHLPDGADPSLYDPASQVGANPLPAVFVHGKLDDVVPIEGSVRLNEAWEAAGCRSRLVSIEGADHFFNHPILGDQAHEALAEAVDWLGFTNP